MKIILMAAFSLSVLSSFALELSDVTSGDLVVKSPYDAFNMVYNSSNLN